MASTYIKLPVESGGGGGAVSSFNGRTGGVVSQAGDYSATLITNTPAGNIAATDVQAALNELDSEKQTTIPGIDNSFIWKNGTGDVESLPGWEVNNRGGSQVSILAEVDNTGGYNVNNLNLEVEATVNSPSDVVSATYTRIELDPNSLGFDQGTNGAAVYSHVNQIDHAGTSDVGSVNFVSNNFNLGNGTDPIDVKGFSYQFGFGQVNSGVTVSGPMQGYGYQPNIAAGATVGASSYTTAFYDGSNIQVPTNGHVSYSASPQLDAVTNNNNVTGVHISPTIDDMQGNSNCVGVGVYGNLGTFGTGSFSGVQVNPTIDEVTYAAGLNVSMDSVTVSPETVATLIIQDLTITGAAGTGSDANSVSFEYVDDATAGAESVTGSFPTYVVHIESGVSTATQVKAAIDAYGPFAGILTAAITGTPSDPQVTQAPTFFSGGINAGRKQAAYLDGDVEITGSLQFGGALSIGQLNAFAGQALFDGGGSPASIHTLITQPTVADNVTVANADLLGVNTAMLLSIGTNSTVTTGFLGVTALGLPAVVSMGTGSTVDQIAGATFAISLDGGAAGGTIDNVDLCRAIAIPNGVTTVNTMSGFKMDLPFGDPATQSWGVYITPEIENYMAGSLKVGTSDTVANSSVAIEIESVTRGFLNARMTTTEKLALTAIAGLEVYDTTLNMKSYYNGTIWVNY